MCLLYVPDGKLVCETDPPRLPWPILCKALTMANGTLYNDCSLAMSTVGQAFSLDPCELVEA